MPALVRADVKQLFLDSQARDAFLKFYALYEVVRDYQNCPCVGVSDRQAHNRERP